MELDGRKVVDVELDNVSDYPDFADAYICAATWNDTGMPLSDKELDRLQDENDGEFYEMCYEWHI